MLVPAAEVEEPVFGQEAIGPVIEALLRGVGEHLQADEERSPGLLELLEQAELRLVDLHRGVLLAEEDQPDAGQAPGDLGRGQHVSPHRVDHAVDHQVDRAITARRVADLEMKQVGGLRLLGRGGRGGRGGCRGQRQGR